MNNLPYTHRIEKKWGHTWNATVGKQSKGIQGKTAKSAKPGQVLVCSFLKSYMWTTLYPEELFKLIEKDRGIREIIPSNVPRKVYFDVDMYGDELKNVLESATAVVSEKFMNANLQVSGSIGLCSKHKVLKHSYHIVLSNYFAKDLFEMQMSAKFFAMKHKDIGFDTTVYEKNKQMKAINQSKLEKPRRVQAYIEGSRTLSKHLVLHDFDEDSIDVSTLDFDVPKELGQNPNVSKELQLDLFEIPQLNTVCPEDFDWYLAKPREKLSIIPNYPVGHPNELNHNIMWRILHWAKGNDIPFKIFWAWCRQRRNDEHSQKKWSAEWERTAQYKVSDTTIQLIVGRFIPQVLEHRATRILRSRFNVVPTKIVKNRWLSANDISPNVKSTILMSAMGANKTGSVIDYIARLPREIRGRVLWLTPTITLSANTIQRLRDAGIVVVGYKELTPQEKRNGLLEAEEFVVCSIQSLHYTQDDYDMVVIDEIEALMFTFGKDAATHRDEDTKEDRLATNYTRFKDILTKCKKLILMDAFVTQTTMAVVKHISQDSYESIDVNHPPEPRKFQTYDSFAALVNRTVEQLKAGKKLFFFSPFVKHDTCGVTAIAHALSIALGWEVGKQILVYHAREGKAKKALAQCEVVWSNPEVRIVITNSCITVGVNFNMKDVFDEIHCYYHSMIGARFFIQALYRVRFPISNVMHIFQDKRVQGDSFIGKWSFPKCKVFADIYKGLCIEDLANLCTKELDTLHLFMEKANITYTDTESKVSKKVREKVKKMYEDSDLTFDFDHIPDIDSSDVGKMSEKILAGRADATECLSAEKYFFRKRFVPTTPEKTIALAWNLSMTFPTKFIALYFNDDHIIRQVMRENGVDTFQSDENNEKVDEFPDHPKTSIPLKVISRQFRFHNPVSAHGATTVPRMINTFWGMTVLSPADRDQSKESIEKGKTKYETSGNYTAYMEICRRYLKICQIEDTMDICGEDGETLMEECTRLRI